MRSRGKAGIGAEEMIGTLRQLSDVGRDPSRASGRNNN